METIIFPVQKVRFTQNIEKNIFITTDKRMCTSQRQEE